MQVTAVFDAVRVTNGVPQWWLAQAGLGTDDAAAPSSWSGLPTATGDDEGATVADAPRRTQDLVKR